MSSAGKDESAVRAVLASLALFLSTGLVISLTISQPVQEQQQREVTADYDSSIPGAPGNQVLAELSNKLTWAPPDGWENYQELVIPSTGGIFDLDPDINYRISAPQMIRAPLMIRGGGNIVAIGGHIRIDGPEFDPPANGTQRRALVFRDDGAPDGRVVHFEGWLMDGEDLAEGINPGMSPNSIFQLQNIRVEQVTVRSADDRDGTGIYTNGGSHPDILQLWSGIKELRVDKFTGRSNYQGLYDRENIEPTVRAERFFRRTNFEGTEVTTAVVDGGDGTPYSNVRFFRCDFLDQCGQWRLDPGTVWMKGHQNSTWDTVWPRATVTDTDSLGTYHRWDGVTLTDGSGRNFARNWDDNDWGKVYEGSPPGGDYVLASTVGIGYTSPGYMSDSSENPADPDPAPAPDTDPVIQQDPTQDNSLDSSGDGEENAFITTGSDDSAGAADSTSRDVGLIPASVPKVSGWLGWAIPAITLAVLLLALIGLSFFMEKWPKLKEPLTILVIVTSTLLLGNVLVAASVNIWVAFISTLGLSAGAILIKYKNDLRPQSG